MGYKKKKQYSSGWGVEEKKKTAKPVKVEEKPGRVERNWSDYQKKIFKDIAEGSGHTIIMARAGSGKTSVLVEGLYHIPADKKTLMVAFNKAIADELQLRAPNNDNISISTLHSYGLKTIRTCWGNLIIDKDKCFNIAKSLLKNATEDWDTIFSVVKTVSLCKGCLIDIPDQIDELMDEFNIEPGILDRDIFIQYVIDTLKQCKLQKNIVDFDDMIWFPIVYNLLRPVYDRIWVDEAQDLNASQMAIVLMSIKKDGRVCACGDPAQAIYGWRNASSEAIYQLKTKLNAVELPLSISYRCAKSIIKLVQEIVPDIEHRPDAPEGKVEYIDETTLLKSVKVGDFILSRTNAPLIRHCLALLKMGTPANIQGRDVGVNLKLILNKSKKKSIGSFLTWLHEWKGKEIARLIKAHRSTTEITDKVSCLESLCEGVSSLQEVKQNIDKLFADKDDTTRVILSTVHKVKGDQRNRVFVLRNSFWDWNAKNNEESRVKYVALTRAINELYIVSKKKAEADKY